MEQLTVSLDDEREQNNALMKKNASNLKVGVVCRRSGLLFYTVLPSGSTETAAAVPEVSPL